MDINIKRKLDSHISALNTVNTERSNAESSTNVVLDFLHSIELFLETIQNMRIGIRNSIVLYFYGYIRLERHRQILNDLIKEFSN